MLHKEIEEKHSFKKKSDNQENMKSSEPTVNEVLESITTNKNYPVCKEPITNEIDEDDLTKLFDKLFDLMLPMSDWLTLDITIVNSEASLQGRSATHKVKI